MRYIAILCTYLDISPPLRCKYIQKTCIYIYICMHMQLCNNLSFMFWWLAGYFWAHFFNPLVQIVVSGVLSSSDDARMFIDPSWSLRPKWFGWFMRLHWTYTWTLYEHIVVPPKPVILDSYIWFVRYFNYFESLVTFLMNHSSQHLHPAFVFIIAMAICPALGSAAELTVVLFIHLMVGGWKFTYAGWNLLIVINPTC